MNPLTPEELKALNARIALMSLEEKDAYWIENMKINLPDPITQYKLILNN